MTRDKPDHNRNELELAESKLAGSRDLLEKFREFQNSFAPGSTERVRVAMLIKEVEILQRWMGQLCQKLRARMH
jgi:hypothetical protein